jgi:hypothetical protein
MRDTLQSKTTQEQIAEWLRSQKPVKVIAVGTQGDLFAGSIPMVCVKFGPIALLVSEPELEQIRARVAQESGREISTQEPMHFETWGDES